MEEIYKPRQLLNELNEAVQKLLDTLFTKLNEANQLGVYFHDLTNEYGLPEAIDANKELIGQIKALGIQHRILKQDLRDAMHKLATMCRDKFDELLVENCIDDNLMRDYLTSEYQLAISLGGVIPFLEKLDNTFSNK